MSTTKKRVIALIAAGAVAVLALTGCGAGTRTGNANATKVECDYEAPDAATTVNVLAYNSSAIDPFTDTMVTSCTKDNVTVKHDPIDFGGQVTKTTATLAGDTGTYDILETYGFVIPDFATDEKLVPAGRPLRQVLRRVRPRRDQRVDAHGHVVRRPPLRPAHAGADVRHGLPRRHLRQDLGIDVPTTFAEMIEAAEAIKAAGADGVPDRPAVARHGRRRDQLPGDDELARRRLRRPQTAEVTLDTPEAKEALEAMLALQPYMDPQVTTFDQPKVQQQMYNGTAAMSIMFSGRMNDLTLETNSKLADTFAFAAPPEGQRRARSTSTTACRSTAGRSRSTPKLDHDMLFEMMASAVSEDASKASVPAAYPAREGMVTAENSPYGEAANESIAGAMPPVVSPIIADITNAIRPIIDGGHLGEHLGRGRHGADAGRRRGRRRLIAGRQPRSETTAVARTRSGPQSSERK